MNYTLTLKQVSVLMYSLIQNQSYQNLGETKLAHEFVNVNVNITLLIQRTGNYIVCTPHESPQEQRQCEEWHILDKCLS